MAEIAVFDMNETTLDLAPARVVVDEVLAPAADARVWFARLLQLSMTVTATGRFVDFGTLARHALQALGGDGLAPDAWTRVASALGTLDPHPEVPAGLERLRAAGWTTVALTNSAQATVDAQCGRPALAGRFDHVLSVEAVQTYKPAAAPYHHAAAVVGAEPAATWMVACHDWDLAGARAVGMRTAFVERPGQTYAPTFEPADLSVPDFTALADALVG